MVCFAFAVEGEEVDVARRQLEALLGAFLHDAGFALEVKPRAVPVQQLVHLAQLGVQQLRLVPPVQLLGWCTPVKLLAWWTLEETRYLRMDVVSKAGFGGLFGCFALFLADLAVGEVGGIVVGKVL